MKNVQVIDGADNCTYSIFEFSDEEFSLIFPEEGQDIEFIEDVIKRIGDKQVALALEPVWKRMIEKRDVRGIHGTLFCELASKKRYYPSKRAKEMIAGL